MKKFILVFLIAVLMPLSLLTASCSQENACPHFKTSGEAVTAYREHLSDVQHAESMEWEKLAASVASWQELRDSVSAALQRDTLCRTHDYPEETFRAVHRSIATEYERLALAKPRTYREVLCLKEQGTPAARREDLRLQSEKLQPFFASLDTMPLYKDTPEQALARYDRFLSAVRQQDGGCAPCAFVGLCYHCQLQEALPAEAWDERMTHICTDREWLCL